VPWLLVTAT